MKYEEVINYVLNAIQTGNYKAGKRIPSIRKMSILHNVNKSTILRAYEELEKKHIVYSIPKSGYYVISGNDSRYISDEIIDFSSISPDKKIIPIKEFNHCINKAIDLYKSKIFGYGDTQGLFSLRKALSKYFMSQDIYTNPENICVTNGAHQALSILCSMDFPNNKKKILIEQPTYVDIYNTLDFYKCEIITIERNLNGLDLVLLEKIFKENDIKFFYTMSRFHNPLGTCLSHSQKKQLIKLSLKYNVYIVEDDYLAEIDVNNKNMPLFYFDNNDMVIYIRSFSKSFMPGIRLGCAIIKHELIDKFLIAKKCYDLNTSVLNQAALELYITSGMYQSHIKKIRNSYWHKHKVLTTQIKHLDKNNEYINPENCGYMFWLNLGHNMNSTLLANELMNNAIKVCDGKQYFLTNSNINGFRLSINALTDEQIRFGLNEIFSTIKQLSRNS